MEGALSKYFGESGLLSENKKTEYIPPRDIILKILGIEAMWNDEDSLVVSGKGLREILMAFLRNVYVDEVWYKETYLDIAAAIMSGDVASCREHFICAGYFEGRLPSEPPFNESWYLRRYPDVAEACRAGTIVSARAHFIEAGWREGRAGISEHDVEADKWVNCANRTAVI